MRQCTNCGATIREGAKYCTTCGARQNDLETARPDGVWESSLRADSTPSHAPEPEPSTEYVRLDTSGSAGTTDDPPSSGFSWSWGGSEPDRHSASSEDIELHIDDTLGETEGAADGDSPDAGTSEPAPEPVIEAVEDVIEPDRGSPDDIRGDTDETQVLAGFSEQWTDADDFAPKPPATPPGIAGRQHQDEDLAIAGDQEQDEEDTVAKAERLIGELRRIIPSLARPRPVDPRVPPDHHGVPLGAVAVPPDLLDELESASTGETFDDVRELLERTRSNPRDVDTMLGLAGKTDRLNELLEDRNRLASRLESLAKRLRGTGDDGSSTA